MHNTVVLADISLITRFGGQAILKVLSQSFFVPRNFAICDCVEQSCHYLVRSTELNELCGLVTCLTLVESSDAHRIVELICKALKVWTREHAERQIVKHTFSGLTNFYNCMLNSFCSCLSAQDSTSRGCI